MGSEFVTFCCYPSFDCVITHCHAEAFVPIIEAVHTTINLVLSRAHLLSGSSQMQFKVQALPFKAL